MTWTVRLGASGLAVVGGSFAASFGRGSYVRGGYRAQPPRHTPQSVLAATTPVLRDAS
jgi:hypothetical protein